MATHRIDLDRGVTIRKIVKFGADPKYPNSFAPDLSFGGLDVIMYKDEPGVYYDVHGRPINEKLAEKAGFPTARHRKQKLHKEKLAEFERKLAAELAIEQGEKEVLAQNGIWQVVALPMDRADVIDAETGEKINAVPMSRADAQALFETLTEEAELDTLDASPSKAKGKE